LKQSGNNPPVAPELQATKFGDLDDMQLLFEQQREKG